MLGWRHILYHLSEFSRETDALFREPIGLPPTRGLWRIPVINILCSLKQARSLKLRDSGRNILPAMRGNIDVRHTRLRYRDSDRECPVELVMYLLNSIWFTHM